MYTVELVRPVGPTEKIIKCGNRRTTRSLGGTKVTVSQTPYTPYGAELHGHATCLSIYATRGIHQIVGEDITVLGSEEAGAPICVNDIPLVRPVTVQLEEGKRLGRNGIQAIRVYNWGSP